MRARPHGAGAGERASDLALRQQTEAGRQGEHRHSSPYRGAKGAWRVVEDVAKLL
jgi:hypothetical protein